jgi:DNA repair protein RAD5
MESPHPDERPAKKRRFFAEDSSPVQIRTKEPSPRPQSPPPAVDSHEQAQPQSQPGPKSPYGGMDIDGFDVGLLESVVGCLHMATIKKLKEVSGNDVERGRHGTAIRESLVLTSHSNQPVY